MKKVYSVLPLIILLIAAWGCFWGEKKTETYQSGRLEFVKYMRFGPAGTHGSEGWYIHERELKVNGRRWQPKGINVKDITCEASPNQAVESLKCSSFGDMKETIYIIRMKDDKPELVTAAATEFAKDDDSGSWADDGHWLLFRNYYFNVETSEKKEVRGLPGKVGNCFIAASPDLETIIYLDGCYEFVRDEAQEVINMDEYEKHHDKYQERQKNGNVAFWLIEAKTGAVKILELKIADYPFANNPSPYLPVDWVKEFNSKLVWEKDKNGKDQLVYPK